MIKDSSKVTIIERFERRADGKTYRETSLNPGVWVEIPVFILERKEYPTIWIAEFIGDDREPSGVEVRYQMGPLGSHHHRATVTGLRRKGKISNKEFMQAVDGAMNQYSKGSYNQNWLLMVLANLGIEVER